MSRSAAPEPRRPMFAVFVLLGAAIVRTANCAPSTYYGVQLPDPLHVYTLQEAKPENLRNDPFLVVFKTHIPSLRPYEIPYFPSKDHLSAEEQDGNSIPNNPASSPQEQTTVVSSTEPEKIQESVASGDNKVKGDEQIDMDKLPELVELKPEALLEALDASKQDAEESVTARPADPAAILADAPSNGNSETTDKGHAEKEDDANNDSKTSIVKENIDDNSSKKEGDKENDTLNKESQPEKQLEKEGESLSTVENDDSKKQIQKEEKDKENKLDVDRVEKEGALKQKVQ